MYSSAYTADTEWNDTAWKGTEASKRFNEVVIAARSETDDAKRETQYFEAQQLLHDDGGAIVALWVTVVFKFSKTGEAVASPVFLCTNLYALIFKYQ